jgi:6-pyruvoyltetrahydropterin/6-carboxytetrahydropterin synthase
MYRLTREVRFAVNAAPDGQFAAGGPTNAYAAFPSHTGLAHYFTLSATLAGELDPASNYLINIKDIDRELRSRAVSAVEDVVWNRPQTFGSAMVAELFALVRDAWRPLRLDELVLGLSPFLTLGCRATEYPMTRLSQTFEFAAAHRLHNPALSDEANRRTYGKCNNPMGHGHNYEVRVTVAGTPDAETGLLVDVPAFERVVGERVIERLDHKHLNAQVPEFAEVIPSVENIARVIYGMLKGALTTERVRLASVTVWETPKTWCEYSEP